MPSSVPAHPPTLLRRMLGAVGQWIDSDFTSGNPDAMRNEPDRVDWIRCIPFIILHLGCLGAIWVGASPFAVSAAVALYFVRMFAVTGRNSRGGRGK